MLAFQKSREYMEPHIQTASEPKGPEPLRRRSSPVGKESFVSVSLQRMINIHHNAAHASAAAHGTDL